MLLVCNGVRMTVAALWSLLLSSFESSFAFSRPWGTRSV